MKRWINKPTFSDDVATRWRVYVLALLVGITSGLVAASFHYLVNQSIVFRHTCVRFGERLALNGWVVTTVLGVLLVWLSAWTVRRFAPEASGSGVQEVEGALEGLHRLRWWLILPVKYIAGLVAMAAGLVLGREGPTIHMGGSLGEMLAKAGKMNREDADSLMAAGAGAGLAAAFNAPLAGILFVTEEMRRQFKYTFVSFHAVIIASVVAVIVNALVFGQGPSLAIPVYPAPKLENLLWYGILGVLLGGFGVVFNHGLLKGLDLAVFFRRVHPDLWAILVGAIGGYLVWALPEVMGGGEDLSEQLVGKGHALSFLVMLIIIRTGTTIASYSSGVPGGIFAPMLALGTLAGLAYGVLLHQVAPGIDVDEGAFAVAAMGALFAATVRAPLTGIILIAEMTRNYQTTLASIVTCLMASLTAQLLGGRPIYRMLLERSEQANASNVKEQEAKI